VVGIDRYQQTRRVTRLDRSLGNRLRGQLVLRHVHGPRSTARAVRIRGWALSSKLVALRVDDVDLERDRALVERFQAGDDEAFDELYRRYHDRLERFCRKRVGDQHTAEELTQEAFTRALSALPDLSGELRFYPWVSVIAARLCVDSYRRESRSEPASDPDPGPVAGGQEDIIDAVDVSLVATALSRLAPRHQDVLHLREVEGWSYQRIAAHYGVKVGTVETLLFRARRALRREFHLADGAGLLAWPVVGRLIQATVRVRNRLPTWAPSLPSPTAVAAAATATAAAVVLAVAPSPPTGRPGPTPPTAQALAPASPATGTGQLATSAPTARGAGAPADLATLAVRPVAPPGTDPSATGDLSTAPLATTTTAPAPGGGGSPVGPTDTVTAPSGSSPSGSSPLTITSPLAIPAPDALAIGGPALPLPALPIPAVPGVAVPGVALPGLPGAALPLPGLPTPLLAVPTPVVPAGPALDTAQTVLDPVLGGLVPGH
jgi:RNA polymerase sigma factor (sigma-70 family)